MLAHVADLICGEVDRISLPVVPVTQVSESSSPTQKRGKLFDRYGSSHTAQSTSTPTAAAEFRSYLELCDSYGGKQLSCLEFWAQHSKSLPRLHEVALKALSVPATSAPVERVFSCGGIFMRPHRARLSNRMLSDLVFLKCNNDKL